MSFNKRFFTTGGIVASSGTGSCATDSADVFGDASGVALYTLDYDASNASGLYDGVPTNVEFGVGGQINYGARFNGSSSVITKSNFASLSQLGLSMWVKISDVNSNYTLAARYGATREFAIYNYQASNGFVASIYYNGNNSNAVIITAGDYLTNNTWHHIAFTSDGSTQPKLYIDGVQRGTAQSNNNTYYSTNEDLQIGAGVSRWLNGDIDQVRIFNRALNSTEVSTLYAETACVYTCTTDTVDYPITNLAYYKLDNTAEDETGTYDGTATNVNYTFGRFGQAAVFNSSSSNINIGGNLVNGLTKLSISLWVNWIDTTNTIDDYFIALGKPSSGKIFSADITNNTGIIGFYDGVSVKNSTGAVPKNIWTHIVITADATALKIYLNGSLDSTHTISSLNFDSSGNAGFIGSWITGTDYEFDGAIDQVRIFSSALDSTQVESLYNEKPCEDTSTFQTVLYTGNDSTQYVSNVGFEPDLVWVKNRTGSFNHILVDSIRGANNLLFSDTTAAALTSNTTLLSSIDELGFTVGYDGTDVTNGASNNYVAWCWKAGGASVLNQVGDIDSQVSANTAAGFSIVKWTGNGTSGATVGHSLSSSPEMVIYKRLDSTANWIVKSTLLSTDNYLLLNANAGSASDGGIFWNSTVPSSTLFTLGNSLSVNGSSASYIAYCWHSVAGVSKIGSYTGTGATGNSITTGFEPSFVMIKRTDDLGNWVMFDGARGDDDDYLYANTAAAEVTSGFTFNLDVSGFTVGGTASWTNAPGGTYIYMAFK